MLIQNIVLVLHVIIAVALVALVLLQQGKGADAGAAFGAGASGTVFGSKGSSSFLTRTTGVLATAFFITSLTLFVLATETKTVASVVDQEQAAQEVKQKADLPVSDIPNSDVPAAEPKKAKDILKSDVPVADPKPAKEKSKPSTSDVPAAD